MEEKKTNIGEGDYMKLVLKDGKEAVVKKPLGARFGVGEEGYPAFLVFSSSSLSSLTISGCVCNKKCISALKDLKDFSVRLSMELCNSFVNLMECGYNSKSLSLSIFLGIN